MKPARLLDMNNIKSPEVKLLQLPLCPEAGTNYLVMAATLIRDLPFVIRVRVDQRQYRLEILYTFASQGVMQQIHQCLLVAGEHMTPVHSY
jgi:hypothetical protein